MVTSTIFSSISNALLPPSTFIQDGLRRSMPKFPQKKRRILDDDSPW